MALHCPRAPLLRMSGQECAERDWNAEVLPAQVKEQHPMEVVAQNARVKQLHTQLLGDLDDVRRQKKVEEYDRRNNPVEANQKLKRDHARLMNEMDEAGRQRKYELYAAKHDLVAENQRLKAARQQLLQDVEKLKK